MKVNGVTATDNEACGYYALAPSLTIVEAEVQSSPVGILEFLGIHWLTDRIELS